MSARPPRLGDLLDDYCPRCRLVLNHAVVGMVGEAVKKVRCLTCQNEHAYRHGKAGRRRKDSIESLFDQVLRGMPRPSPSARQAPGPEQARKPEPEPGEGEEEK